ncbi:AbrB family transcriptional regulator [Bacillus sp. FJAT-27251]|uniref:AbrB family transcriptional regulator n=1 Tax=Bacillus sp. FJAT-27251 TaxID=1684142 RepID=UPI0006A7866B|nr:AbrB family transcriptional regulator [Bacillus sp. FJAT-27251]
MVEQWKSFLAALGISVLAGLLFYSLHIPLPWLLGSLFAVSAGQIMAKTAFYMPRWLFTAALLILGYMLGAAFTKEAAVQVVRHFPFMLAGTILTLAISIGLGLVTARSAKLDLESAVLGSVPGGLAQMLVISKEMKGINQTIVVFLQVIRLLAVVLLVPFFTVYGIGSVHEGSQALMPNGENAGLLRYMGYILAALFGYVTAKQVKLPNSILTGPLIGVALVSIVGGGHAPELPSLVIVISQIIMGINLGLNVHPQMLGNIRKFGLVSIGGSMLLVVASLLIALALDSVTSMGLATAFLGMAPGGIAEMGLTAAVVKADLSMVSGYQLFRLLFILFIVVPLLQRWIKKRQEQKIRLSRNFPNTMN